MAETLVENQICNACGADVREGSLFCYNCGGRVATEIPVTKDEKNKTAENTKIQESLPKENGTNFKRAEIKPKQEVKENAVEKTIAQPITKSSINEETKLKSAATMRGKSKVVSPKKIEIVWEENENAPNLWFILVAVVLTVIAAVILFLAMRMR